MRGRRRLSGTAAAEEKEGRGCEKQAGGECGAADEPRKHRIEVRRPDGPNGSGQQKCSGRDAHENAEAVKTRKQRQTATNPKPTDAVRKQRDGSQKYWQRQKCQKEEELVDVDVLIGSGHDADACACFLWCPSRRRLKWAMGRGAAS